MAKLDVDFLARALHHPEEFGEAVSHGIHTGHFFDPDFERAFQFITQTRRLTGKVPDPSTVADHTGMLFPVSSPEPLKFYCIQLIRRLVQRTAQRGMTETNDFFMSGRVEDGLANLHSVVRDCDREASFEQTVWTTEEVEPRWAAYEAAEARGGMPEGLPTPWEPFTRAIGGFRKGKFGLYVARLGVGKTFALLMSAHSAWDAGAKPLVISVEMLPADLQLRHDAYIGQFPLENLLNGTLTPAEKILYRAMLDELAKVEGVKIVGHNMATTTHAIEAAIERVKPDIVLLDGAYLIRPVISNIKAGRNERLSDLADELTILAHQSGLPFVGTLQLNREQKTGKKEIDAGNIYGADTFGQHADFVVGFLQSKEDRKDKVMRFFLVKNRFGVPMVAKIRWDFDTMEFEMLDYKMGTTSFAPPPKASASVSGL